MNMAKNKRQAASWHVRSTVTKNLKCRALKLYTNSLNPGQIHADVYYSDAVFVERIFDIDAEEIKRIIESMRAKK